MSGKNTSVVWDSKRIKEASDKLDEIRGRTKPVTTDELLKWIREDRERIN